MSDELLTTTNWIVSIADKLLLEDSFNDLQRKFLLSIADEARELQSLLLALPDIQMEQVKHMLSFDGRSHLTSIIGYSEVLLDEVEGDLTDNQRDLLHEIRFNGKQLLIQISELVKSQ